MVIEAAPLDDLLLVVPVLLGLFGVLAGLVELVERVGLRELEVLLEGG